MDYKVTAFDLRLGLLQYLRFERQWICVDEFRRADVVADTGKDIIEIEIKVDKGDLANKECYKTSKHHRYRTGRSHNLLHPNRFYFCVTEALVETAINVSEALNSRYGIIAFNPHVFERHILTGWRFPHRNCLRMARSAKRLHESYANHQQAMAMRTSAKIVSLMEADFRKRLQELNSTGD